MVCFSGIFSRTSSKFILPLRRYRFGLVCFFWERGAAGILPLFSRPPPPAHPRPSLVPPPISPVHLKERGQYHPPPECKSILPGCKIEQEAGELNTVGVDAQVWEAEVRLILILISRKKGILPCKGGHAFVGISPKRFPEGEAGSNQV